MLPQSLETDRLRLRRIKKSDSEKIIELVGNFNVSKMLEVVPYPYTKADADWWIGQVSMQWKQGAMFTLAIEEKQQAGLLGVVSIQLVEAESWEFGYWLGQSYWGNGYMTEAGKAYLQAIDKDKVPSQIYAGYFIDNKESGRVLEKLGFIEMEKSQRTFCKARGDYVDLNVTIKIVST